MKKWLQKTLVITVAMLTLGLITPNHEIWDVLDNGQSNNGSQNRNILARESTEQETVLVDEYVPNEVPDELTNYDSLLTAAKEQTYIKFGSKIAPVIGDEFEERIYPKLEEVIEQTFNSMDEGSVKYLALSSQPSGQYSEKIFHISHGMSGEDLLRFHVRTEKRPQEGYYYNFHYHTADDNFVAHHSLGDIYWSKDTPPKWLS
ncbi:hypothetical protein D1B33_08765 [Lysinibacillus yapensis]|uniref:Cell division protein FtsK n=1 Tax=Ureibacillus yapensis TaxID=2304605 RepID=A0A396SFS5_9BACL|nr:YpjP family protein [Lysinibacillus yapensis]RHW37698.1 hypothetical protein D1B33_08765 [Lysinibacillus yapensis]